MATILNGQQTQSGILSSSHLSDDYSFIARATGTLDLSATGLPSNATLSLTSSSGTETAISSGKYALVKDKTYTIHVAETPPNNPPGSGRGSGGTGSGSGSTGSGSGSTGGGSGSTGGGSGGSGGTGGTIQDKLVEIAYAGSITQVFPPFNPPQQAGTLGLGSSVSGIIDFDSVTGFLTSFTLNGEQLSFAPGTPPQTYGSYGTSSSWYGYSSDPSIRFVDLSNIAQISLFSHAGTSISGVALSVEPSNQILPYGFPYSDNIVLTFLGTISGTGTSNGSASGTGSSGSSGSASTSSGSGSGGGSGLTGGIPDAAYSLTFTADYAGNDLKKTDPSTLQPDTELLPTPVVLGTDKSGYLNITSTDKLKDFIGSKDPVDYYRFQINTPIDNTHSGTNVSIKLKGLAANVKFEFLDGQGNPLLDSSGKTINPSLVTSGKEGSLQHIFSSGTYYIRVDAAGGDTNYTLDFTETPLTTNLTYTTTGNTPFLTNLWEFDASGKNSTVGIDPTKPTVVVIHGWNKSGATEYGTDDALATLATTIASQYSGEQVLALDWGKAAKDPGFLGLVPLTAAGRVEGIANWAVSELEALGLQASQITLIGHSLGAYVADVIGHSSFGEVDNLYALDPAGSYAMTTYNLNAANGGSLPIPRFDSAATNSYAFFDPLTPADDSTQARTAQYTFIAYNSLLDVFHPIRDHFEGVYTLTAMFHKHLFNLNLSSPSFQSPPLHFQYGILGNRVKTGGQYDGFVQLSNSNGNWNIASFKYIAASGQEMNLVG